MPLRPFVLLLARQSITVPAIIPGIRFDLIVPELYLLSALPPLTDLLLPKEFLRSGKHPDALPAL